jgi:SH3 domain protein
MKIFRCVPLILVLYSCIAWSEDLAGHVSQEPEVKLKTGYGKNVRVIRTLEPGTALIVTGSNPKNGMSEIKIPTTGETGWIPTRQIVMDGATSPAPLNPINPPSFSVENSAEQLANKSPEELITEVNRLRTEMIAVRQAAGDSLKIQTERDQLQQTVISLKQELEQAHRDRNRLNDDQKQAWFLIGGSVLLVGIVLGVILPRLSVRRKSDWGTF